MAGRYGHETVSVINLKIVAIDKEHNLLLVNGSIPGRNKSLVRVKTTISHIKKVAKPFNLFIRNQPEVSAESKDKSQETTV